MRARERDCLHGKWIHGSRIRVNLAKRESQAQFWWRKLGDSIPGDIVSKVNVEGWRRTPKADVVTGPPEESRVTRRRVEGLEMEDFLLVLQRCSIGWCWSPISNSSLAKEIHLERISGVHVMRISGNVIEERLKLFVGGRVYLVRISESDTLLHGPRVSAKEDSSSSLGESVCVSEEQSDREDVRGTVNIYGSYADGMKVSSDEEAAADFAARAGRSGGSLVDVAVNCVGPVAEGSNAEMLVTNGHKRKVRLLTDIISSLHSLEEKRKADKADKRRGCGRPQEAILKEAAETMKFGKLLGAKTIGCEAIIVHDIGLGSSVKRSTIRRVLRQQCTEMVFLVETKLEVVSEALIKSKFVVWDSSIDPNFVLLRGKWCVENYDCGMVAVYAPCEFRLQQKLWRRLVSALEVLTTLVCCGGDFNAVLSLEERRHCVGDKRDMVGFVAFVEEVGLLDLRVYMVWGWFEGESFGSLFSLACMG
ncbi:hypothetical protein V6N13_000790 [Hibiscus sabdariffa]